MFSKTKACFLLFIILGSCSQKSPAEQELISYWNNNLLDSSYKILYAEEDTTKALQYFDSLVNLSGKEEVFTKAGRFTLIANYHYFFSGNNEETARMLDSARSVYELHELQTKFPRTYVGLLLFGGQIAYRLSQYHKANDYYFRARELGDAYLSDCEKTPFNYSIAMVLYRQQNYRQSLDYFKEAYTLQANCSPLKTPNILQQQEILANMGLCYVKLERFDSAMIHFDSALSYSNRYKDSLGPITMDKIHGVIYGNKALVSLERGDLKGAEWLSKKSIALNDREGYEFGNAQWVKLQLAEVYRRQGNYKDLYVQLMNVPRSILDQNAKTELEWLRLMELYYEQIENKDSALYYSKIYYSLKDSIEAEQRLLTEAAVTRQLTELQKESEIRILKSEKKSALIFLWIIIGFAIMALVIILLVYQNFVRSKKNLAVSLALNSEIRMQKAAREQEARQQHKIITEAVIRAQENERSLIGLELHDNINQVLTTVKLHNEMIRDGMGDQNEILNRSSQYLQNCINEIRGISKRLSGPTLGKIRLEESVSELVDSINVAGKINIDLEISGLEDHSLKQDVHLCIYRILQEQLNNIIKHADATAVLIKLECKSDKIYLLVCDNGNGFDLNNSRKGMGLMNMQTRAENLNGSFTIHAYPGKGCKVEVVLPLENV